MVLLVSMRRTFNTVDDDQELASERLSAPRPAVLPIWRVCLQMVTYATGSPGPRDEMDRTIGGHRERGTNALSQGTALLL